MRVWRAFSWEAREASFSRSDFNSFPTSSSSGSALSSSFMPVCEGHWEKPFGRWSCQDC